MRREKGGGRELAGWGGGEGERRGRGQGEGRWQGGTVRGGTEGHGTGRGGARPGAEGWDFVREGWGEVREGQRLRRWGRVGRGEGRGEARGGVRGKCVYMAKSGGCTCGNCSRAGGCDGYAWVSAVKVSVGVA